SEIRERKYFHSARHERLRIRFQRGHNSASRIRLRTRAQWIRERRLYRYDGAALRRRTLFHNRGFAEVGARAVWRQAAPARITRKDDHAVQERLRLRGAGRDQKR